MSGGGVAPNGNTSNLPLFGTPEQQMADPFGLFPGTPPSPASMMGNLGNQTTMPFMPKGAFNQGIHPQGSGPYNAMAANSAGRLFNPTIGNQTGHMNYPISIPTVANPGAGAKGIGQSFQQPLNALNKAPGIGGGNANSAIHLLTGGL